MPDRMPPNRPGAPPPSEAMKKLAEMIRRAETGRRIRLTRKGKLAAFIVPPEDVQRLEWLEEQERLYRESQNDEGGFDQMTDYDEPAYAEPAAAAEPDQAGPRQRDMPEPPPPPRNTNFDDERQRQVAIAAFRKGFDRIIMASDVLSRSDISRRLKPDGYIASAILSIIGEG
jgi:prevent-host-death family protein